MDICAIFFLRGIMSLLDLLFKTEKPTKEVLVDDIISLPKKEKSSTIKIDSDNKMNLGQSKINVYSPKNQEEIEKIVLNLQNNEASIINLKEYERNACIRVLDFLNGAVFALKGDINRLTKDLYLISPQNLKIKVLK